jgi:hypothetical protein
MNVMRDWAGLFVLAVGGLIAGCSTIITDDSRQEIFRPYIGQTWPLQIAQRLCMMPNDRNFYSVRQIKLSGLREFCPSQVIVLPVGTLVTIQSVSKQWMPVSVSIWYAMGKIVVTGEEFEYPWAYVNVHRAPWDMDSVPPNRTIPN